MRNVADLYNIYIHVYLRARISQQVVKSILIVKKSLSDEIILDNLLTTYDLVEMIWWRHDMDTYYWPFVLGNVPSIYDSNASYTDFNGFLIRLISKQSCLWWLNTS